MNNDKIDNSLPKNKQNILKWNGWGYNYCKWTVENDSLAFKGGDYEISDKSLPELIPFIQRTMGITYSAQDIKLDDKPFDKTFILPPIVNETFEFALKENSQAKYTYSSDEIDRFFHSKGQNLKETYMSQNLEKLDIRIVDLVVWPTCENDVVILIDLCNKYDVVIIPFGGGTNVSGALTCPSDEKRMIISVDMSQMSRIIWLDEQNLTLCVEAGIIGQDLERKLQKRGYTVGHEPDSLEFSSLGGWISTRASGMKKNTYGNIEDLLVNVNYITPIGVINKKAAVPRMSCGPDLDHIILGSEGTMGIITTAVLKIRPLPPMTEFDSIVFHCFEDGIKFCRQIARERTYCASIRLIDNNQFQFGYALKPSAKSFYQSVKNSFVKFYVTKYKGIDVTKMSIATLVFVGTYHEVCHQRSNIFRIAATFNGFSGGAENGRRGYNLTNSIAYIRDLALKTNIVAESFETSAPWDKVDKLISNVKQRIHEECKKYEISNPFVSARVTQLYDEGACIYFYLGLYMVPSIEDPIHIYEQIEMLARDEIIANGGCISHHHGVGTIRKKWYKTTISETAHDVLKSVKKKLDPNNIFANGNLTNKEYS